MAFAGADNSVLHSLSDNYSCLPLHIILALFLLFPFLASALLRFITFSSFPPYLFIFLPFHPPFQALYEIHFSYFKFRCICSRVIRFFFSFYVLIYSNSCFSTWTLDQEWSLHVSTCFQSPLCRQNWLHSRSRHAIKSRYGTARLCIQR